MVKVTMPSMLCALAALWAQVSWAESSAASPYGPSDRLGALNILTPDLVVQAARLVKTGKVYSLAIATEAAASTATRSYRPIIFPVPLSSPNKLTGFDDMAIVSFGMGTSMDGLGHIGRDGRHYNGVRADEVYSTQGAKVFGIDTLLPIVARGILLDIARHRNVKVVAAGAVIDRAEIEAVAKAQGITIRRGDVVLFHTGSLNGVSSMGDANARAEQGEAGLDKTGARFLAELGVIAVGGAVEAAPFDPKGEIGAIHQILLVDNGIYIFEFMKTEELAADRAYEFLFIAAAPRLAGTVQSILHPIAIR